MKPFIHLKSISIANTKNINMNLIDINHKYRMKNELNELTN